jgi:putative transposase
MPHSYSNILTHIVFSTKSRRPFIDAALETRLFPYFGGIIRQLDGKLYIVNGVEDHVTFSPNYLQRLRLLKLSARSKAARLTGSISRFRSKPYSRGNVDTGQFSVSKSKVAVVARYIEGQKEHHKKQSFQDEFLELLRRHGISINEKYLWT